MKTLIIYCSSHGTTKKAVRHLTENLEGVVLSVDLKRDKQKLDLNNFDAVIIGGSIHVGMIQRKIKQFIEDHYDELLEKEIGLFLCCMEEGDRAIEQFNNAFPKELRKNSVAMGLFGGEFLFSKMNIFEKQIVKKITGTSTDQFHLDMVAIKEFAERFNSVIKALV